MTRAHFEVVIVGGGIAGASLAYFLGEQGVRDVLRLEREAQPGRHATGRSAAVLMELDPVPTLQRLKVLSAPFLRHPPTGFCDTRILTPSGILVLLRGPLWEALRAMGPAFEQTGIALRVCTPADAVERVPVLVPERFDGAVLLPEDGHLDVHALLHAYLRHARARGATVRAGTEVRGLLRDARGRCSGVVTAAGEVRARWVVNAAGAWAADVGRLAEAAPIPLVPHRRTIVTFAAPDDLDVRTWPLVASEADSLYFAPESGGLLLSPMDEEPMPPCDPPSDDGAVAEALERLRMLAPRLAPRALRRRWAGLRTFAPDRVPVVGEDAACPGFFWLAGQGGCGIETSPAMGRIAAELIVSGRATQLDAALLAPERLLSPRA
jgi:D-arginine dehydrogenase